MGGMTVNNFNVCCISNNNKKSVVDIYLDTNYSSTDNIKQIIIIQSIYRGYKLRKIFSNYQQIKEISVDFSTDNFEKNKTITRLNELLPKFELTDKEEYEINHSQNKISAFLYPNHSIYKGMINNKYQREGLGKLFFSDGSIYKGFFHNDLMNGRGRLMNVAGYIYEGEFKNGLSNGYGKYVSLDGTTYKGSWLNDKQNGYGNESYPDGSSYNGYFKNGKKNGNGKLIFREKNMFDGSFVNNEICGEGAYYWKDGRVYIGYWAENKMCGYGIFIWPDKKKYYGKYINNLKEGFGIFYWSDGHRYEGFWKEGKQHGYGCVIGNNGLKYGEWVRGNFNKKISDQSTIDIIVKKINEAKCQKDYKEFSENIEKYEKQIIDGSSSQDTNFNSKGIFKGCNNFD